MAQWQPIDGGIAAPKGFLVAGIAAGLKPSGAPDLALLVSETEATAAGTFTTSSVRAACVDYCRQKLLQKARARAILCNAGQANAATGTGGWEDAIESARLVAEALQILPDDVLLASTGVIGQRIDMSALGAGIPQAAAALSATGSPAAARAIMTTDLAPKEIALETALGDRPVRIGGIAKGSGMICPNMATMLAFITCDAAVAPQLWQQMLSRAVACSFNQITVDGDTSTNDTVLALANGQSRAAAIVEEGPAAETLEATLIAVCQHLAKAIARDGEGATCLIEVRVGGAPSDADARQVAKSIAGSSLLKAAVHGRDPNWGRIAMAAGKAGVAFDAERLHIRLGDFVLMCDGTPQAFERGAASEYLRQAAAGEYLKSDTVVIAIDLGAGSGQGMAWGCDLSYDYVRINAEYTT